MLWGPRSIWEVRTQNQRAKAHTFFKKSPWPISMPVSFSQDGTWLVGHPAPLCSPTRGTHRAHCCSFGFPLSSLGSPPGPSKGRWGRWALFRGISENTSLSSNEQSLSHSFPLLQNKVAFRRKKSQVLCPEEREGPRGADSEHRVADPPALLLWTVKEVWRDDADKAQGQA